MVTRIQNLVSSSATCTQSTHLHKTNLGQVKTSIKIKSTNKCKSFSRQGVTDFCETDVQIFTILLSSRLTENSCRFNKILVELDCK